MSKFGHLGFDYLGGGVKCGTSSGDGKAIPPVSHEGSGSGHGGDRGHDGSGSGQGGDRNHESGGSRHGHDSDRSHDGSGSRHEGGRGHDGSGSGHGGGRGHDGSGSGSGGGSGSGSGYWDNEDVYNEHGSGGGCPDTPADPDPVDPDYVPEVPSDPTGGDQINDAIY